MLTLLRTRWFWLKFLSVKGSTSYQSHQNRTELHLGFSRVDPGVKHRMSRGAFLEFAFGKPTEEDITRFEDNYGR